ncbi:hypothetical protein [Actinomadura sp. 9N215]|uniref:hypothetical protein n=1 Tax=Actinomadura sp. 9N215 TaxID=3375150 RepID=UPI0037954FE0
MTIRTEVVSLLCGIDMTGGGPATWRHEQDGRPLTDAERDLALSATREEIEAVRDYAVRAQEYHTEKLADFERIEELTRRYAHGLPDGEPMGAIVARMDGADRAEFLQIMERLAPDGTLWTPGGGS